MVPEQKVKDLIDKHRNLEKELSLGNINPKLFAKKSKEYSNLGNIIDAAKSYINFEREKKDLTHIIQDKSSDKEIRDLAQNDLNDILITTKKISNKKVNHIL